MKVLHFELFVTMKEIKINPSFRASVWLNENPLYLMPCEFKEVQERDNFYKVEVIALDPDDFVSNIYVEKEFSFGNPRKIIGHGILKKIEGIF